MVLGKLVSQTVCDTNKQSELTQQIKDIDEKIRIIKESNSTSPYGPNETSYFIGLLKQIPDFMDCTDTQLDHFLNLDKQWRDQGNGIPSIAYTMTGTQMTQEQYIQAQFEDSDQHLNFHCS